MKSKKAPAGPPAGTFETSLKRLEEIVDTLEEGSVTLDQVVVMYEEGVHLSKECLAQLQQAELKLKRLSKDVSGNFQLIDQESGA